MSQVLSVESFKLLEALPNVREEVISAFKQVVTKPGLDGEGLMAEFETLIGQVNGRAARKSTVRVVKSAKVPVSKASKTADTGGKGRKECPSCHKFVGARVKICPNCQHVFVIGETKIAKEGVSSGRGRRAKGESLGDIIVAVLKDAATDGRRKERSLDLAEIIDKLPSKGYQSKATQKNLRMAVQQRVADLVKKGEILRHEDEQGGRKYSVKVEEESVTAAV